MRFAIGLGFSWNSYERMREHPVLYLIQYFSFEAVYCPGLAGMRICILLSVGRARSRTTAVRSSKKLCLGRFIINAEFSRSNEGEISIGWCVWIKKNAIIFKSGAIGTRIWEAGMLFGIESILRKESHSEI